MSVQLKKLVVGLTGGIGSGKSAAADRFAELGAAIVDADVIAHELTGPAGAAMPAIREAFGAEVVRADGALDRQAMRRRAFADPGARVQLEGILHPMIREESRRCGEEALARGAPYLMLVVPLLIESGEYRKRSDRILVIDCPETLQIARVKQRSGLEEPEVRRIMAAQASRTQRLDAADDVIVNDAGLAELHDQVDAMHLKYRALAEN